MHLYAVELWFSSIALLLAKTRTFIVENSFFSVSK